MVAFIAHGNESSQKEMKTTPAGKDADWNIPFSHLSLDVLSVLHKFHPMRLVSQAKHGTIHTFHAHLMSKQMPRVE